MNDELIRQLTRLLNKFYNRRLDGISSVQLDILNNLANCGKYTYLNKMASELKMDRTTICRDLPILIRMGYADFLDIEGIDARKKTYCITAKGKKVLECALSDKEKFTKTLSSILKGSILFDKKFYDGLSTDIERLDAYLNETDKKKS